MVVREYNVSRPISSIKSIISFGHLFIIQSAVIEMPMDGLEGFWSWAKEWFIKHHVVSEEHFPLYLKELGFTYNNRNFDIFEQVAKFLCNLVPKRD
jgi:hypothetical protein